MFLPTFFGGSDSGFGDLPKPKVKIILIRPTRGKKCGSGILPQEKTDPTPTR